MKYKALLIIVIIYLMTEVLAEKNRQLRISRQLHKYLQPPPHEPPPPRAPPAKPRVHPPPPGFSNHQPMSTSLAQRVARWFFDSGNEGEGEQGRYEIKQQNGPWIKPNYGPPKPPRNFHGPPRPHAAYGPSRPPPFRGPNRPPHFLGPPRPSHPHPPPPPHTLNLSPNPPHGHRPPPHNYLPLNPQAVDQGRCNPCNKVPWVPVPHTSVGGSIGLGQGFRNIEQLPLEDFNGNRNPPDFPPFSAPSGNDRPIPGPPDSSYGPPLLPHVAPGPPFNSGPSNSYGLPVQSPSNQYGPPYPSTSDHQDVRQGNAFGGQSLNKPQAHDIGINGNEQFGYPGGNDPQAAATHHNSQDGSLQFTPDAGFHSGNLKPSAGNGGHGDDIEVVKSVRVADFLASVEYPLEIIQSPVIDIDQVSPNTDNNQHKSIAPNNNAQFFKGVQSNTPTGNGALDHSGSSYNKNNEQIHTNGDHKQSQAVDQKEQQATVHQVVSTANGKIIKGRPIVVDGSFIPDDSEENKINSQRPAASKGLTNFTNEADHTNKHISGGSTFSSDFTPSLQTQAQSTSLIHNINNLNIYTQQLPPSAPFTNTFQQKPSQSNFPLGVNSNLPPSSNPVSSPSPFNNFQHNSPAPIDVLKSNNINQQNLHRHQSQTGLKQNFVTSAPLDTSSWIPVSTTNSHSAWSSTFSVPDSQSGATFNNAGLLPPPPPRPYQANKKPKQIQVIVPYTSRKQLLEYQVNSHRKPLLDHTGWLPLQPDEVTNQGRKVPGNNCTISLRENSYADQLNWQKCREIALETKHRGHNGVAQGLEDYHQHEESRTVTATVPQTLRSGNSGGIHHIVAPNIRALLKGEEDTASPEYSMFNLQKSIDEWTALEYSGGNGGEQIKDDERKGTTSLLHLLVPSKKIPDAYLTTTPSTFDDESSENMVATAVPSIKKNSRTNKISVKSYQDHEISGSNVNSRKLLPEKLSTIAVKQNTESKSGYESEEKFEKNKHGNWSILEANLILPEETTPRASYTTQSVTSTTETRPAQHSWDHLEMSISPITKEKVYVVTPMSNRNPNTTPATYHVYNRFLPVSKTSVSHTYSSTIRSLPTTPYTSSTLDKSAFPFRNDVPRNKSFHSPRFLVRPTPGSNLQKTSPGSEPPTRFYSADGTSVISSSLDDGRGDSSRVQTITGHSKVVTLPTTPSTADRKWSVEEESPADDEAESFLQSLAKLLTTGGGGGPTGPTLSAALREATTHQ